MQEDAVASPAEEFTEVMDAVTDTRFQMTDLTDLTLFRIEIDPDSAAAQRMEKVLGAKFPRWEGEVTGDMTGREVLYGTRQIVANLFNRENVFLIVTRVDQIKLGRALEAALAHDDGLVLNVSVNRAVINLSGPDAARILADNVLFENKPKYFAPGMAFRVMVEDAELMLWKIAEEEYLMIPRASDTAPFVINILDAISEHRA
ncbi:MULTISPECIES: hypothetical protein [unclassified Rothia (in: high G+C Gram-positive bacteria)]|uniref:hypothetical protein n=1 Tax=unclassified Rothia (in: high G+C Gram-positive bacteria) TaxID=2689056 RepID=UPI00195E9BB8|nr:MULTISPECIES: hypothetical protein [unclassified Rothia (in: high G+C Gram-positive bacteria)]MBM7052023.1 hypothetical protein [Rothia sp. ZJ1223]QRZ61918.1 hypothetical protein JR346_01950 [Rothia sp. ZJ932]